MANTPTSIVKAMAAIATAAPVAAVQQGYLAASVIPAAATAGHIVRALADLFGRPFIAGYDFTTNALTINDPAPAIQQKLGPITFAALTAVGSTVWTNVRPYSNVMFQVTIAALAALETCVVRIEGSHDGTNPFNLSATGLDMTIGANGTYVLGASELATEYVRFTFVTDSATAAVTLAPVLFAGN